MGDLVRYLPDGKVHYAGRRDTQVKLRGKLRVGAEIVPVLTNLVH